LVPGLRGAVSEEGLADAFVDPVTGQHRRQDLVVVPERCHPQEVAGVGEGGRGGGGAVHGVLGEAEVLEEAVVEAPLDGDGARRALGEHHEGVFVRGSHPGEGQGASVLAQIKGVLEDVVLEAVRRERTVGEAAHERVCEYAGVDALDGAPEFAGESFSSVGELGF